MAAFTASSQAQSSVTLAWNRSPDPTVIGYRVYQGGATRAYTNSVDVGNATNATVRGLVAGSTYFFAVTAYDGVESDFSSEIRYTVPVSNLPPVLAISTTSLPGGVVNAAYTAALTDSGGTDPCTWSVASGSLPPGLALNATSGALTGTPTAAGTFSFTARVSDAGSPIQSATKALSITITSVSAIATIWPSTTVPGLVDGGSDRPVELGVKFRSDVAGTITGIRFYKASANTGTHIGNLWTSTGTRLASATFTSETASGWQQVNFATPVAISASTVYVASYHADNGHYSADLNYFSNKGMDTPPLHALANGVSGGNGVYAYGTSSLFPSQTWYTANYWVDVAFQAGTVPTLASIAVTPANPGILTGASQQFTATGTYSDGSAKNITSQVTWSSSAAAATISAGGLAKGVAAGTTSISAAMGSITGSTTLTVRAAPLSISTTDLPNGVVNAAYTAALTDSGGTDPCTWSIASGSLPPGLALNATSGALTGTPTAAGTFSFTARVSDAGSPIQSATKALSITITSVSAVATIWPSTTVPGLVDGGADRPVELGVKFRSDVAGTITGIRFYKASANTGTHIGNLWTSTGTRLASATFTGETASGWQQVNFATPVAISASTVYVASYHADNGHYSADLNYFSNKGMDTPPLHALANGVSGGNGVYAYGTSSLFPSQTWYTANYWVDVAFQAGTSGATPPPWQSVDIGTPGATGSATGSSGLYTVNGAGNLSGTADNFRFLYQPLSADGEIRGRINSAQTATNGIAGVMIRENLTGGSSYTFMGLSANGSYRWQARRGTSSSSSAVTSGTGTPPNAWVRLVRTGNILSGYKSADGTNWTQVASRTNTMAANIHIGFAVASGSTNTLNTATFNNVTVAP